MLLTNTNKLVVLKKLLDHLEILMTVKLVVLQMHHFWVPQFDSLIVYVKYEVIMLFIKNDIIKNILRGKSTKIYWYVIRQRFDICTHQKHTSNILRICNIGQYTCKISVIVLSNIN